MKRRTASFVVESLEPRIAPANWSGTIPNGTVFVNTEVHRITGDATVAAGSTLTIQAGAVVKFDAYYLDLFINGTLIADGSSGQPIVFTEDADDSAGGDTNGNGASSGVKGEWGRIEFGATSSGNVLDYVEFRYGGYAVLGEVVINTSSLTMTNSTVRDSSDKGLRIATSNPTLTNTTFQNNTWGAATMDLASNPVITGVTMTNNGINGLLVDTGTLTGNGFWNDPDIVYVTNGDITIPAGNTLTVAPGQVVKFGYYSYDLFVNGTLNADGTSALPIIFTEYKDDTAGGDTNNNGSANAPYRGNWGKIEFSSTSTASVLDYVEARYGGYAVPGELYVNGGQLTLTNSVVTESDYAGLRIASGNPTLSDNTFSNNTYRAISIDLASNPVIGATSFSNNGINGVLVDGGTLTGNAFWNDPTVVYVTDGDITIPAGNTLTVAPGQVVKFGYYSYDLFVNGTLNADGTSALPIIFTEYKDDTAGGDTNNNGSANAPYRGNWGKIEFSSTSTASVLDYVEARYGGYAVPGELYVNGGQLTLTNSVVSYSDGVGVRIENANPTLTNNTYQFSNGAAISMNLGSNPTITGSSPVNATSNGVNGLLIDGGTLPGNGFWDDSDIVHVTNGDITVPIGSTLTVSPGVIVKLGYYTFDLFIEGTLNADGTAALPIIFTEWDDDTAGGDTNNNGTTTGPIKGEWGRIEFAATSSGNVLDHIEARYGAYGTPGEIQVNGGSLTLTNSIVRDSYSHGVQARNNGSLTLSNNLIYRNNDTGLRSESGSTVTSFNNTIDGNYRGIGVDTASATVTNTLITYNTRSGIFVAGSHTLNLSFSDVYNPTASSGNYEGHTDETGINGNFSSDPSYLNRAQSNFGLLSRSTAVDAATSSGAPTTDFFGNARFDDPGVANIGAGTQPFFDVGAIERQDVSDPINLIIDSASANLSNVQIGDPVLLSWTIRNNQIVAADGDWTDSVFVSTDATWDIDDTLIGTLSHTGGLASGATYNGQLTVNTPPQVGGTLYFILRIDSSQVVRESVETDNEAVMTATLTLPQLATGGTTNSAFTASSQDHYYQITVTAGGTLEIALDSAATSGANELYVRFDDVPSASDFDYKHLGGAVPDQQVVIPTTEAGTYYLLVRNINTGAASYSLTSNFLPFSIRSVSPGTVGNAGFATLLIRGAQFAPEDIVTLTAPDGSPIAIDNLVFQDAATLYASFDFTGFTAGAYDVSIDNTLGAITTAFDVVSVVAADPPVVAVKLIPPGFLRRGRIFTTTLTATNTGSNDAVIPLLLLDSNGKAELGFSPDSLVNTSLSVVPRVEDGPTGTLRPGETWSLTVFGQLVAGASSPVNFTLDAFENSDSPIDIAQIDAMFSLSLDTMFGARANEFQTYADLIVGETNREFVRNIYIAADQMYQQLPPEITFSIEDVFLTELQMATYIVENGLMDSYYQDNNITFDGRAMSKSSKSDASESRFLSTGAGTNIETVKVGTSGRVRYVSAGFTASESYASGDWVRDLAANLGCVYPDDTIKVVTWNSGTLPGMGATILASAGTGAAGGFATGTAVPIPLVGSVSGTVVGGVLGAIWGGVNYYRQKANRTEQVGSDIAQDIRDNGDPSNAYIYGHSLGAHAAGYAGRELNGQLGGIVGFDPAGEGFGVSAKDRLDPSDARNVKAIHTSSSFGHLGLFGGKSTNIGHENYYPPHGRWLTGAHGYSYEWYNQRVKNACDTGDPDPWLGGVPTLPGGTATSDTDPTKVRDGLPSDNSGEAGSTVVQSIDPNDLLAPAGFGAQGWLLTTDLLPYTIQFENDPQFATAPAQEVVITNQLDADMDLSTFELGTMGWGSVVVPVPAGLRSFATSVDTTNQDGSPLRVNIQATLNPGTGLFTIRFTSVDPATGMFPEDPFAGFLPVDDDTHRGEGFVTYTVYPKSNLTTGTTLVNQASIIFDDNDPLLTPSRTNTIDAGAPTSTVTALPATTTTTTFTVNWSGNDDAGGSGIAFFDIFVSDNGSPFTPWKSAVSSLSASYTGEVNHSYGFYSVATDNLGHQQSIPAAAQTLTTVVLPPPNPNTIKLSAATYTVAESASNVVITLSRSGTVTAAASVVFTTTNGSATAGADYTNSTLTVNFAANETTKTVQIPILEDGAFEGAETVTITLTGPVGATLGTPTTATLTITDNDAALVSNFKEADGDLVNISLKGAGTMQVSTVGGEIRITLTGTDVLTSTLGVKVKKAITGDGQANLTEVTGTGGLRGISGKTTNVVGDGVTLAGALASVAVRDISADIIAGGTPATLTSFKIHAIGDGATIDLDSAIKSLAAARVGDSTINAPSIASISVKGDTKSIPALAGDFLADVNLSGAGLLPGALALGKMSVANIFSGTITSAANLGSISVGRLVDAIIMAGFAPTDAENPMAGGIFTAGVRINSVVASGATGTAWTNSAVIAAQVGSVRAPTMLSGNGGQLHGVLADESIGSVAITTPAVAVSNPLAPFDTSVDDFHVTLL